MWKRVAVCGVVAGAVGLLLHVGIGTLVTPIVASGMRGVAVQNPPYSGSVQALALLTSILPGVGIALAYLFMRERLPGRGAVAKGAVFALLLLLINGELLRQPIMDLAIGNPLWVVFLQRIEPLAVGFGTAFAASAIVRPKANAVAVDEKA